MSPRYLLLGIACILLVCTCDDRSAPALELERRILAPCCYRQSLEDHESPIARMLRQEIERRIAAGEPAEDIENDLVQRYGMNVRAAPPARWAVVLTVIATIAAGMMLVLRLVRRKDPRFARTSSPILDEDCKYADQLDDELATVD